MSIERKRPRFKENELIEIPLPSGRFGYCRVLRRDDFGTLFAIYRTVSVENISLEDWLTQEHAVREFAYVNSYSARERWRHVGVLPPTDLSPAIPPMFFGASFIAWTIEKDGKQTIICGKDATVEGLKATPVQLASKTPRN